MRLNVGDRPREPGIQVAATIGLGRLAGRRRQERIILMTLKNMLIRDCGTLVVGVACSGALTSCTGSRTFVLEHASGRDPHMVVSIRRLGSTVPVAPELATRLEARVARDLGPSARVDGSGAGDLVIGYRFVLFESGNAAARAGAGIATLAGSPFCGVGEGALGVDVQFSDAAGMIQCWTCQDAAGPAERARACLVKRQGRRW